MAYARRLQRPCYLDGTVPVGVGLDDGHQGGLAGALPEEVRVVAQVCQVDLGHRRGEAGHVDRDVVQELHG